MTCGKPDRSQASVLTRSKELGRDDATSRKIYFIRAVLFSTSQPPVSRIVYIRIGFLADSLLVAK